MSIETVGILVDTGLRIMDGMMYCSQRGFKTCGRLGYFSTNVLADTGFDLTQAQRNRMAHPYTENGREGTFNALEFFEPTHGIRSTLADIFTAAH